MNVTTGEETKRKILENRVKKDDAWNDNYERLVEYHMKHGNLQKPYADKNFRILAKWAARQRQRQISGTLPRRNKELLDEINFRWTSTEDKYMLAWMERYQRLISYKEKHNGNTAVPQTYPPDPELGIWVANQRKLNNQGKLKNDRKKFLEKIDFEWKMHEMKPGNTVSSTSATCMPNKENGKYDRQWKLMYNKLLEYYKTNGNCNIPYLYPADPALSLWVHTQRRVYHQKFWYGNKMQMKQYRKELLEQINFEWNIRTSDPKESVSNKNNQMMTKRKRDDEENDTMDHTPTNATKKVTKAKKKVTSSTDGTTIAKASHQADGKGRMKLRQVSDIKASESEKTKIEISTRTKCDRFTTFSNIPAKEKSMKEFSDDSNISIASEPMNEKKPRCAESNSAHSAFDIRNYWMGYQVDAGEVDEV